MAIAATTMSKPLLVSLLIFALEHGLFPGPDVWDGDKDFLARASSNCVCDGWGCYFYVTDKPFGQLLFIPSCMVTHSCLLNRIWMKERKKKEQKRQTATS